MMGSLAGGIAVPAIATSRPVQPARLLSHTQMTQAATPQLDTSIVPGERLGPITGKTTYQDLVKIFGAERLSDIRPPDADDTEREFGTRINLGPDWSLTLVWQDKTKTIPYQAMDMGPGWKMIGGLHEGMTIADLQPKLGPFQMVGLGGPYGGIVPLTNTRLEPYFGKLIIQMAPAPGADKQLPKNYQAVSGERLISASDPNWQPLNMKVKYLIFLFPRKSQ